MPKTPRLLATNDLIGGRSWVWENSDLAERRRRRELPTATRRPITSFQEFLLSTPYENANLLMRLYDLRREAKLRDARDWVIRSFNPSSAEDYAAVLASEDSAKVRMVMGYWDMAASFVVHGAIDTPMFHDTCGEMLAAFCKVEHMLTEVREHTGQTGLLGNVEQVANDWPGAKERMAGMREYFAGLSGGD